MINNNEVRANINRTYCGGREKKAERCKAFLLFEIGTFTCIISIRMLSILLVRKFGFLALLKAFSKSTQW